MKTSTIKLKGSIFQPLLKTLDCLTKNCDLATFGVLKEEKLDLDYRSAWKLDNTKFLTSFHPFDSDVMEMISDILLPISRQYRRSRVSHLCGAVQVERLFLSFAAHNRFIKDRTTDSSPTWTLLVL